MGKIQEEIILKGMKLKLDSVLTGDFNITYIRKRQLIFSCSHQCHELEKQRIFFKPQNFCCKCIVAIIFLKYLTRMLFIRLRFRKEQWKLMGRRKKNIWKEKNKKHATLRSVWLNFNKLIHILITELMI